MIETQRLILREMGEWDYEALYRILADSDIMQHYPYTFDEGRVRNWIARNRERYRTFGFGLWAVCLKEAGEMIGDCGLTMQLINGQRSAITSGRISSARAMPGRRQQPSGTGLLPIPPSMCCIPI